MYKKWFSFIKRVNFEAFLVDCNINKHDSLKIKFIRPLKATMENMFHDLSEIYRTTLSNPLNIISACESLRCFGKFCGKNAGRM